MRVLCDQFGSARGCATSTLLGLNGQLQLRSAWQDQSDASAITQRRTFWTAQFNRDIAGLQEIESSETLASTSPSTAFDPGGTSHNVIVEAPVDMDGDTLKWLTVGDKLKPTKDMHALDYKNQVTLVSFSKWKDFEFSTDNSHGSCQIALGMNDICQNWLGTALDAAVTWRSLSLDGAPALADQSNVQVQKRDGWRMVRNRVGHLGNMRLFMGAPSSPGFNVTGLGTQRSRVIYRHGGIERPHVSVPILKDSDDNLISWLCTSQTLEPFHGQGPNFWKETQRWEVYGAWEDWDFEA